MASRTELPLEATENGAEPEPETRDSRRMDPELRVMGQMLRLIEELEDDAAKARAVDWLYRRFYTFKESR